VGPPERGLHFGGGGLGRSAQARGGVSHGGEKQSTFTLRTPSSTKASISAPVYLRGTGSGLPGVSGPIGPGLCRMLDTNFREHSF
jgi:hypothetical protein